MILTITTTHNPATDLGFLLHKNPANVQTVKLPFGQAHVFYPEASVERCTCALLLDIDPIGLVRRARNLASLAQYVNDRPYVASSFLSVALKRTFGTAMTGRSKERPELAGRTLPLSVTASAVPCRGGEGLLRDLFEPLGYTVEATRHPLDDQFPEWGAGPYFTVSLAGEVRLQDLLTHLYVLLPVLDDSKHYWVGQDELDKLLESGAGWLFDHPQNELIVDRYLKHRRSLTREALARLAEENDPDPEQTEHQHEVEEEQIEERISLNEQRIGAVVAVLHQLEARRVLDLGCGEGKLLRELLKDRSFEHILGMDVSYRALEIAARRLHLDRLPERQRARIKLIQGSLMYRDRRLAGFDAAAVVEVIEHLDPPRLATFERVVFEFAAPRAVVVTTPNAEYNVCFETLPAGQFRHKDHRFEWTRKEFQDWAGRIANRFNYSVRFLPVGPEVPDVGAPTQMGVFSR